MLRQLLCILLLISSQAIHAQSVSRAEEGKAYTKAISEYLKATGKRHGSTFDTLVIGKRPDFPSVTLPSKVDNTIILFLTQKENDKKRKYSPKLVFVNMVGDVTKDNANFVFVTFYPGYTHQYDCMMVLNYNTQQKAFLLDDITFKNYAYK